MLSIQERYELLDQIEKDHNRLIAYYDSVIDYENKVNVLPIAFSAKSHYEFVYLNLIQKMNFDPLSDQDSVSIQMDPVFSTQKTIFDFDIICSAYDDPIFCVDGYSTNEGTETILFQKIIENCDYFFDIGANLGYYSFLAAKTRNKNLCVFAFEPVLMNFEKLTKGIEINKFESIIRPYKVAVGKEDKPEIGIFLNRYGSGGNSTIPFSDPKMGSNFTENVPLISLDKFLKDSNIKPKNALIKIDVEGSEEDVLLGAKDWLSSSNPPLLIFETFPTNNSDKKIFSLLSSYGYRIWGFRGYPSAKAPIFPSYQHKKIKRSAYGNYLAVNSNHQEILQSCIKPLPPRLLFAEERFRFVVEFQLKTFESLDNYVHKLTSIFPGQQITILDNQTQSNNDEIQSNVYSSVINKIIFRIKQIIHRIKKVSINQ